MKENILKHKSISFAARIIKLLHMSEYIDDKTNASLLDDCLEIKRILVASINTAKENVK